MGTQHKGESCSHSRGQGCDLTLTSRCGEGSRDSEPWLLLQGGPLLPFAGRCVPVGGTDRVRGVSRPLPQRLMSPEGPICKRANFATKGNVLETSKRTRLYFGEGRDRLDLLLRTPGVRGGTLRRVCEGDTSVVTVRTVIARLLARARVFAPRCLKP